LGFYSIIVKVLKQKCFGAQHYKKVFWVFIGFLTLYAVSLHQAPVTL